MNALVSLPIDGEIIGPGERVRVVGRTHPLSGGRVDCRLPAGLTIAEMLIEVLEPREMARDFVVYLDGHVIERRLWSKVRVKQGVTVTFAPRLGDNTILRSTLAIVIAVAAMVVAPYAAPAIVSGFAAIGVTVTVATATALVAGGVMLAASLALNALFPTRPPAMPGSESAASLNSIQGAQNQTNPFGPIPVVLGRHRQSPYYAAKAYTEIVGNDQYLRLFFCLGYGPLEIEDIRIGETPLTSFGDYEIQVRQGFDDDVFPTLYPGQVDEQALSITMGGSDEGPPAWYVRTTSVDTDEISIDVTATEGIFRVNKKTGKIDDYSVRVEAEYAPAGSGAWVTFDALSFYKSVSPSRMGLRLVVARGQYDVRVRKAQAENQEEEVKDTVVWTALRSIRKADPITFPHPLALVALRIRASNQLSGVIDTFNCVTTSLVKAYSGTGSVWNDNTASQWPPDLFRHVLQGKANARPRTDAQIDLEGLQEWWAFCVAKGLKFNQVINSVGSVYDKLADIAAAGRAVVTFIDGKWGVVWDRPADSIVQHFTPRNSWGFQGQKPYAQQPHGWRVKFINEENGFTADERIVYDDGYDASNATLFEGLEFPGVTDPDLIWKHGRFHIAQSRLRPEKFSLNVAWEHLVCTKGDRVRVTHDVPLIGLASGRIKQIAGQVITLDEEVTIEDGKTYAVHVRVAADARVVDRSVDATPAGDYNVLTLAGDLSGLAIGDLFAFGETDRVSADYRLQGISHQKDLIATLTLVDDAPEVSQADEGEIPDYDPHVTIPPDPFTLPPRDLRYVEVIEGKGATVSALVRLYWQVPRLGRVVSFEVQRRDDDAGGDWVSLDPVLPPSLSADVPFSNAGVWSFRVRSRFSDGTTSDWVSLIGLNLQGLSAPPGDISNLHQRSVDGQTVLDWTVVQDARSIAYEVRKGTSWDTGLVVGDNVVQPPWPTTGDGNYHIRTFVLSPFGVRVYSPTTVSITIADSIISRNIIVSQDEQALGWPGGLDGGVIDGSFIRTDIATGITTPWAPEVIEQLELEGLHIAVYLSSETVDIGRAAECRFWTLYEASGVLQGEDFLGGSDVLGSGDVLGTAPTRFIRAFPIWRFAADGENDVFTPPDVFAPPDVFSSDINFGDWVAIASGTRVARYYKPGFVLITDNEETDATGTKFSWFVDVPDRTDDYTELTVPDTGLDITFYAGGYDGDPAPGDPAVPFNGGPNGADVPHVQRAIVNGTNGDEVKITNLTLAGCTVHVVNAGVNVERSGVNLLVRGY